MLRSGSGVNRSAHKAIECCINIQIHVNSEQQISIDDRLTNCCTKTSIPPHIPRLGLLAMGKAQKKTGKGRLDKYYKLAK